MTATKKKTDRLPTTNRFEFQKPIGSGGMGTVYRAFDRRTGEHVAIKVLKFKLSDHPTLHHRLAREFKAANALEHPNIVRAIAFENDGETSYAVFELVEGCSLGERIETHGRLAESEAIRIITQIAQALQYAHQHQVIHRDVKPDNILVLPDGRAKLTDFGLAKDFSDVNDQDLTRHASALGTPYFMAPEQFADAKTAGVLCDVYSLGATLFNLVTGVLPFDAKFPLAILTKKQSGKVPSARKIVPGISERLDAAIRAAMDPDPKRRPASCLEFFKLLTSRRRNKDSVVRTPAPLSVQIGAKENRRAWVRFPMKVGTCGAVDVGVHTQSGAEEMWPLVVQDLSAGGMGLLLARRFEPGTTLSIELNVEPNSPPHRFPVRVQRVQQDRAGHWIHGCAFVSPLTDTGLLEVLRQT